MGKRIVVKVGSNVLMRADGKTDVTRVSALVDQVVWLRRRGYEVVLVSSGAVSCGRDEYRCPRKLDAVRQRQLYSAIGQVKLIGLYYSLFREYGVTVGQVLTMKESFATRAEYLNQRQCMEVMLDNGVLPVVNENDTVSVTELMFTDNDELSGLVASMIGADTLVILTNVDGIYDGDPSGGAAHVIPVVAPGSDLSRYIGAAKSGFGRGGMLTKTRIASKVAEEGIRVMIANGRTDGILISLFEHPETTVHTVFTPAAAASTMKKWIAHSESFSKGVVCVNRMAADALTGDRAVSLLPVGVTKVEGDFDEGDLISIQAPDGRVIAVGRSACSAAEARAKMGMHDQRPLVHYDYLYVE